MTSLAVCAFAFISVNYDIEYSRYK
jgi:hypothetical protein